MAKLLKNIAVNDSGIEQVILDDFVDQSSSTSDHFTFGAWAGPFDSWAGPADQSGTGPTKFEGDLPSGPPVMNGFNVIHDLPVKSDMFFIQNFVVGSEPDHSQPTTATESELLKLGTEPASATPPPWADQFWVHGAPPVAVPHDLLT